MTDLSWEYVSGREDTVEQRFRIYCRDYHGERTLVATAASEEAVGLAICTLGREGVFLDCALGVLDTTPAEGDPKWVILPWEASAKNVKEAARVLGKAKRRKKPTLPLFDSGRSDLSKAFDDESL